LSEREPSRNSRSASGSIKLTKNKKPDSHIDADKMVRAVLTRRQYQIYYYLTREGLFQIEISKKLKISKQSINEHVKNLEILGVIKPIKKDANPKLYKSTYLIPTTNYFDGRKARITINKDAKIIERRVGKPIKTVRDRKTGRFKGKRKGRGEGFKRNYDTIVTMNGKRVTMWRLNALSYTCTILHRPVGNVYWEPRKGPNGMEQMVLHHDLSDRKSEINSLKKLNITFVRQKTVSTDELIIYLPELYLLDYELDQAKDILKGYVWKARKWFQNTYKAYLSMPVEYRSMEVAREIVDPAMKQYVQKNGMVKIKTKRGYAMVDESKKGYPEVEYSTIEQARADLKSADRILDLEAQMVLLMEQQKKTNEMIEKMVESQDKFHEDVQEFMGYRKKFEKKLESENSNMFS